MVPEGLDKSPAPCVMVETLLLQCFSLFVLKSSFVHTVTTPKDERHTVPDTLARMA